MAALRIAAASATRSASPSCIFDRVESLQRLFRLACLQPRAAEQETRIGAFRDRAATRAEIRAMAVGNRPDASNASPSAVTTTATFGLSIAVSRAVASAAERSPASRCARAKASRASKPPRPAAIKSRSSTAASPALPSAIRSSARSIGFSLGKRAFAVVDDDHVAFLQLAAERDDVPVLPHLGDDGLAGEYRRGEAHVEARDLRRIVFADRGDDRAAGGAVGAKPVQDRTREARHLREGGIAVQRIAVARQRIEKRLIGARIAFVHEIGRARGNGCGSGAPSFGPPKPPSPRAKIVALSVQSLSPDAASFITRSVTMTAPLSLPLSNTPSTRSSATTSPNVGKRLVHGQALLAMHDHHDN